jgi:hypothetical protein
LNEKCEPTAQAVLGLAVDRWGYGHDDARGILAIHELDESLAPVSRRDGAAAWHELVVFPSDAPGFQTLARRRTRGELAAVVAKHDAPPKFKDTAQR